MSRELDILQGVLLDETFQVGLEEVERLCGLDRATLETLVCEGLLPPRGGTPGEWRFSGPEVRRLQRALRLRRAFELDWAATALTLELLDEIERLRREIRLLKVCGGR